MIAIAGILAQAAVAAAAQQPVPYRVTGDAIAEPLAGLTGDARRGNRLVANRQASLCLLCHQGPFPEPHAQGTLAPDLRGVGARLSAGQIRLRIVDMPSLVPRTIMPAYYHIVPHERVASAWRGKPVLDAQSIEDIVAFLVTLKE